MPLTYEEQAARILVLEAEGAAAAAQRDALQVEVLGLRTENARLLALVPPDEDGTTYITVSEYRWHLAGVYQALGGLVTGATAPTQAQLNKRATWTWYLQFLESLDQARRVNTRVAPILQLTNLAFADGYITQAKRDFLNNL